MEITKDKYFWFENGACLKSLNDFYEAIDKMSDDVFAKHMHSRDFAQWVNGVFDRKDIYDALILAKSKKEYKNILKKSLDIQENIGEKSHLITGKDNLEEEKIESNNQFQNFVSLADKEVQDKNYNDAITNYENALKIKADKLLRNKILNVRKFLLDNEAIKESRRKEAEFEQMKSKTFAMQIETYSRKYEELKEKIKETRKEGKDPYIAELHLMNFKAKLNIAEVTREQKDFDVVRKMLLTSEKELIEAKEERIINFREEIEEGAKKLIEKDIQTNNKTSYS